MWAGVATLESHGGDISHEAWRVFADTLRIDEKYPGISGIGVVHYVRDAALPEYLAQRKNERPDFSLKKQSASDWHVPISFIEPELENKAACPFLWRHWFQISVWMRIRLC